MRRVPVRLSNACADQQMANQYGGEANRFAQKLFNETRIVEKLRWDLAEAQEKNTTTMD